MRTTSYEDYFNQDLKSLFDEIRSGIIGNSEEFTGLLDTILNGNDFYLVGTDYGHYKETQQRAERVFTDKSKWNAMSIRGALRMKKFSSDRTIDEYAQNIW